MAKHLSHLTYIFPIVKKGDVLSSYVSFHIVRKCPFAVYLVLHFSYFVLFGGDISLLKMASKWSAEVLSSVPKHKKTLLSRKCLC